MFTLICARINGWVNNREAGDLRRYRAHYDVIVMFIEITMKYFFARWKLCTDVLSNKDQQMIHLIFKPASVLIKNERVAM